MDNLRRNYGDVVTLRDGVTVVNPSLIAPTSSASIDAPGGTLLGRTIGDGTGPARSLTVPDIKSFLIYTASNITFNNIESDLTAINVQDALDELDARLDDADAALLPSALLVALLTVDGAGSGLDADLLDGQSGAYYLDWANTTNKPDPVISITITGDATGSGSVTLTDLGAGPHTATIALTIPSGGVETGDLADNAVTNPKLADMVEATVKGRAAGAGTGDPQDLTAAQLITILTAADGTGSLLDADLLDGQHGTYYLDWANTTNKPDPVVAVTLTGDVSGTASATLTDLGAGPHTITVATSVDWPDPVVAVTLTGPVSGTASTTLTNLSAGPHTVTLATSVDWPDPVVAVTLTGDVSGTASATLTNLAAGPHTITVATAVDWPDPVVAVTLTGPVSGTASTTLTNLSAGPHTVTLATSVDWPDPVVAVTLTGDVSGTASATLTNLGAGPHTITVATSVDWPDPVVAVTLTGDVTGTASATLTNLGAGPHTVTVATTVAAGTIGTTELADDSVTNAKLANMAGATVKGREVGDTTGDPKDLTAAQLVTIINTADGATSGLDSDLLDGQHGSYYLDWANVTSKPDPVVAVTLTGPVSGTASATLTDLGAGPHTVTLATSVDWPDPVVAVTLTGDVTGTASATLTNLGAGPHTITVATAVDWPDPVVAVTLTGPVSGTASATLTNLGAGPHTVTVATSVDWPDPVVAVTLTGDITGTASATLTNLGAGPHTITVGTSIASGTVGTPELADDSVTNAKLANMAGATVKGREVGDASGDPKDLTAAQLLEIIKSVDGSTSGLDADLLDGQNGAYYLDWTNVTSKPDPVVAVTLTGPVTGTASATLTDLGAGPHTVTVATSVDWPDPVVAVTLTGDVSGTASATLTNLGAGPHTITVATAVDWPDPVVAVTLTGPVSGTASTTLTNLGAGPHTVTLATAVDWPDPVVAVTLTGDVTGTASATLTNLGAGPHTITIATTVATGIIDTSDIADNAVTNAKLANMDQATIKGRAVAAGSGDPTDLTAAQVVAILVTADGAGTGLDADLLDGQEGSYYLDWTNITNKPDPIVGVTLTGDVTGAGSTTLTDLANGTVTFATSISADSVGTTELANDSVTNAKLANMAGATIKGRELADPSGDPKDLSAAQVRTLLNVEDGATADQTASEILAALITVDGAASGLDADLLDGQQGSYYLDWANVTSKPDPTIAVTLTGDVTGSNSVVITDLATNTYTITVATTIAANSIALGTDTTGNYVATITGTTNQVNVSGSGSETAAVTLSLPQDIHTAATPTFSRLTLSQTTGTAPMTVSSTTVVTNLNADLLDGQHGSYYAPINAPVFTGGVTVGGDLIVNGSLTTINSTSLTLDDPVITLGGDTAPTVDDNKDRGVEYRWHNGTVAKIGFFGLDDSTGKFTFIPDATNTSEVFSGSKGTIDANLEWADILSKPDPQISVTLTGDVTGTGSVTVTDLGAGPHTITFATTIASGTIATGDLADDAVTNAKLRNSVGLSVIGRSANSTGDPADIVASADGTVLRLSGTTLGFGTLAAGAFADDTIAVSRLAYGTGPFVAGRQTGTSGALSYLTMTTLRTMLNVEDGATADQSAAEILAALITVDGAGSGLDADLLDGQSGAYYLDWTNVTGKPDPEVAVTLTGDVTGTASVVMTDLGAGPHTITIATTIASGIVGTADIADNAVTNSKLADMAAATIKGRAVGAGTGDPTDLTAAQVIDILETADGAGSGLDADLLDGQNGSYYLDWANVTSKPDPVVAVTLTGDVTGTGNATLTDLGAGPFTVTFATNIAAGAVGTTELAADAVTPIKHHPLLTGINIDTTVEADAYWTYSHSTAIDDGTHPSSYVFIANLGGSVSKGIQMAAVFGASDGFWIRRGSDNAGAPLGANAYQDWNKIWTNNTDGAGSGLDADLLDGQQGAHYLAFANFTGSASTVQIADEAVTLAKMAHVATASLLGRVTASTGDVEVLTAAQVRTLLNVENGATADQTPAEILAALITVDGAGSGVDADLLDGQQGTHYLAFANFTGTASTAQLADAAVTTVKIADSNVTLAKMANIATASILGRVTASTGAVEVLTATQVRTLINVENGATADQTPAEILAALLTVDGASSGLDADLLDGQHGSYYQNASNLNAGTVAFARLDAANDTGGEFPISDRRALGDATPDSYRSKAVTFAFSDDYPTLGAWGSGMTVKGWNNGYYAWQLLSYASTGAAAAKEHLFFRNGVDSTWNAIRKVWDSGNLTDLTTALDALSGWVGTAEIADGAITLPKLANIATASILGRVTAATGAVEALTATQVRTIINVENGATADQTPAEILSALITVDGSGTGLDADLLDGQNGSYYLDWTNVTNKPDPTVAVTLTGDVTGSNSVVITDLATNTYTITVATTIAANSIALGTDTTGNYIATIAGTTNQINVSGSGSETAAVTLSTPQDIHTAATPTFSRLTLSQTTGTAPFTISSTTLVTNLNADLLDGQHGTYYARAANSSYSNSLFVADTRAVNEEPDDRDAGLYLDFKQNSTNGLSDGGTYNGVITFRKFGATTDLTGGPVHQLGFTNNENMWMRTSSGTTTWGSWSKFWHAANDGASSGLDADLLDGQQGSYYLDWTNITGKPDPTIAVTLTGDVTGTGSVVVTDLATATHTVTFATTIAANSVALGTDTTGNYVATIAGTTNQISVSGSGSETAAVTLSLPQNIHTGASPTFDTMLLTKGNVLTGDNLSGTASINVQAKQFNYITLSYLANSDGLEDVAFRASEGASIIYYNNSPKLSTTSTGVSVTGSVAASVNMSAGQYTSTQTTGAAPFVVASTTAVTNLNADLLDGQHGSYYQDWANVTNKPDPTIAVTLTGDVTGTGSITVTDLATATHTITFATSLAAGIIATADIANDAVDNTKLANMAAATIKGRAVGAGTGDPTDLTATQVIDILETADGTGSGLDADLLDGYEATAFPRKAENAVISGAWDFNATIDVTGDVNITGALKATTKSFVIDHPIHKGKKLQHGSLECPEHAILIRGRLKNEYVINLPYYWAKLVDNNSITVQLTPIGEHQRLFVKDICDTYIVIGCENGIPNCFYSIMAERVDVGKLEVEIV